MNDATRPTRRGANEPAFALSVDVEEHFQVQAFARYVARSSWDQHPSRVVPNTHRILDLCDETGAKGTFFTLGCVARAHPGLVKEISARGHEVASHGMDHRMLTELSPASFRVQAAESRCLLEDLSGQRVIGFRAPSYTVERETLWAIDVLAETGYAYDSSVYPIRGRRYGYPEGPLDPGRIAGGEGSVLAEFPLPTIPVGPLRFPVLAGAYLRLLPLWISLQALEHHRARGRALILNVHPWELDPEQPTVGPSRRATWTHYARLDRTHGILRALLGRARFRSAGECLGDLGLLSAPAIGAAG